MPRDLPLGNGSLLVTFDGRYCLRDLYFPRVGHDNNTMGHPCRVGVWANGWFQWLHDEGWERNARYEPDTLVTDVEMRHERMGISLRCRDAVHPELPVLVRSFEVTNHWDIGREVRLFFCQDLYISGNADGDTAYYEPVNDVLVHYKGRRYFLINGRGEDGSGIFQYATGTKGCFGCEGTWRDCEDGALGMNPIAQGSVDSAISLRQTVPAGATVRFHTWIAAARDFFEVKDLDRDIRERRPETLIEETRAHWRGWVGRAPAMDDADLPASLQDLYRRSLLIIRTQIDNGGAIIAANDGDSSEFNRDTYSYMWPRDGALVAHALDLAGYHDLTGEFFDFCAGLMPKPTYYPEGYLLHKYNPDGSLGSSWHPWIRDGQPTLPIQEDGTGLVLWALGERHKQAGHKQAGDCVLTDALYERMIAPAARFLLSYRHAPTGLPRESYDLWEERYGILTFTTSAVCAGLAAGARFARLRGDEALAQQCQAGCEQMRKALLAHLYRPELGRFARMITLHAHDDGYDVDATIDASLYAPFAFGLLDPDAPEMAGTMRAIEERLWVRTEVGGVARYENDYYYQRSHDIARVAGNPWIICTLWVAQWRIAAAQTREDLARPREILEWVGAHRLASGVLAEQLDPHTGAPLSVSPLTWSHATYVEVLIEYAAKWRALGAGGR